MLEMVIVLRRFMNILFFMVLVSFFTKYWSSLVRFFRLCWVSNSHAKIRAGISCSQALDSLGEYKTYFIHLQFVNREWICNSCKYDSWQLSSAIYRYLFSITITIFLRKPVFPQFVLITILGNLHLFISLIDIAAIT